MSADSAKDHVNVVANAVESGEAAPWRIAASSAVPSEPPTRLITLNALAARGMRDRSSEPYSVVMPGAVAAPRPAPRIRSDKVNTTPLGAEPSWVNATVPSRDKPMPTSIIRRGPTRASRRPPARRIAAEPMAWGASSSPASHGLACATCS